MRGEESTEEGGGSHGLILTISMPDVIIELSQKKNDFEGTDMMRDGTIMFPNPSNGGKPCNASKKDMGQCSRIPMQQRSVFAGRGGSTRICFSKSPEALSIDVSALVLVSY